jgi:hypothetical protein
MLALLSKSDTYSSGFEIIEGEFSWIVTIQTSKKMTRIQDEDSF